MADLPHVTGYRAWLRSEGYADRTVSLYARTALRAATFLGTLDVDLDGATIDELRAFWLTVPESRESRKQVRCALLCWYRYRGNPTGGPARDLPNLPSPHRSPRPHALDEHLRLLQAARELGGQHQLIAELLGYTGARISEVRCALWEQFDLATPVWYIRGKGSGRRGPKIRQVPLHPSLVATLRPLRQPSGPVFPSLRSADGILSDATVRRLVGEVAEAAGVEGTTPHRWRHTVATLTLQETLDLRALQDLLGHASLVSTQQYTGVVSSRLVSLVAVLPG